MTESEALEILDLSSTATREEQQSAFYNLRAGLSEQVKNAPTPMLRERYTKRLEKVYEAQRYLGLKFSEENPDGSDPLFGDTSGRAGENNLPTTDDGKNNLPARENTFEETVLETVTDKKESKEVDSARDKSSESAGTEKNEEKFREALLVALENGKGKLSDEVNDEITLKQIQWDIPEARGIELRMEVIKEFERKSYKNENEVPEFEQTASDLTSKKIASHKTRKLKKKGKVKKSKNNNFDNDNQVSTDSLENYKRILFWSIGILYLLSIVRDIFNIESNKLNIFIIILHLASSVILSKILSLHIANISTARNNLGYFIIYSIIFIVIFKFFKNEGRLSDIHKESIHIISFCTLSIYLIPATILVFIRQFLMTNKLNLFYILRILGFLSYLIGYLIAILHIFMNHLPIKLF